MKSLVVNTVTNVRNLVILLSHWLLLAYGIVAMTELRNPTVDASLISLVPLPTLFYILTVRYTDPDKLHPD